MSVSIDEQKKTFRTQAKATRLEAFHQVPEAGEQIAQQLLSLAFSTGANISAFWPLAEELDTLPLLHALHKQGHQMLLPVMLGAGKPLEFGTWQPGDVLKEAAFKTLEPSDDKARLAPDIMLCPLLAFDRRGYRMGYGGGFYDRSIAQLQQQGNLLTIGIAFAAQEVAEIPTGEYDMPLDMIVTEQEVIRIVPDTNQPR
jgi:5-formyltetrahydrofolate cyclo-ligase